MSREEVVGFETHAFYNNIHPRFHKTKSFVVSSLLFSFNYNYCLKLQLPKKQNENHKLYTLSAKIQEGKRLLCLTRLIRTSVIDRRIRTSAAQLPNTLIREKESRWPVINTNVSPCTAKISSDWFVAGKCWQQQCDAHQNLPHKHSKIALKLIY